LADNILGVALLVIGIRVRIGNQNARQAGRGDFGYCRCPAAADDQISRRDSQRHVQICLDPIRFARARKPALRQPGPRFLQIAFSDLVENLRFAIIDDHKGFYPYALKYDWVTAAGYDEKGRLAGFNLTDNQAIDPEQYNENCMWVDGGLDLLPPVKFERPQGVEGEWLIRDRYGMVDLSFKPVSMGRIDLNMLVLKVDYYGPFGYVSGTIKDSSGNARDFDRYFGMGEQKYVRG